MAGYHSLGGGGVRKRRLCVVIIGKDDKMTLMTGRPALRGDARVQMTVRGPSVIYFLASSIVIANSLKVSVILFQLFLVKIKSLNH